MRGLRDIHIHIVYGVDDGAQLEEDMHAMLDEARGNGVTAIYCTSHQTPGVEEFPQERYDEHLRMAQQYCAERGYPIRLFKGAEVLYTPALSNYLERHTAPTLGDTRYVLLEFVNTVDYEEIEGAVELLNEYGYVPILAHIERYRCLLTYSPKKLLRLKERHEVRFQVNCSTAFVGMGSFAKNRIVRSWFKRHLVDYVSSDSHNTSTRPSRMLDTWAQLKHTCGEEYAAYLMEDNDDGAL